MFILKQQLDCRVNTELALDKSDYCKIMTISMLADLLLLLVECWQGLQKLEMEKTNFIDRYGRARTCLQYDLKFRP